MICPLAQALGLDGSFWMPPRASTVAPQVDNLFMFIFWVTAFFFVLIAVLMAVFVIKYRYRPGREHADPSAAHSTALEITWTIIPTIIVLVIFYYGFRGFLDETIAPPDSYEIMVTGYQWHWDFVYPDGFTSPELHLPVNQPVRMVMSSPDVIHSLFIPQFRVKKDVVPGRFNRFWFEPTVKGKFDVYCAEYCGTNHSKMLADVYVEDVDVFKKWVDEQKDWTKHMSPVQGGEMLVKNNGCWCHNVDGVMKNAPSFKDLFGDQVPLADGSSVLADENYIQESIYDPAAKVVRGYQVLMSSYKGRLKDRDIFAIIAYMKSISSHYHGNLPTSVPGAATQQTAQMRPTTMPQNKQ